MYICSSKAVNMNVGYGALGMLLLFCWFVILLVTICGSHGRGN